MLYGILLCHFSFGAWSSSLAGRFGNLSLQEEKDNILALAAMVYVLQDWQVGNDPPRGYNIGALLYKAPDSIIGLHRNSIFLANDKTQHAEVGLMQAYLQRAFCAYPQNTLSGMQIVTTLEPCMMCSGMMIFLEVDTVKYIQADPDYGKNIERLAQDWTDAEGIHHPTNERCARIRSISLKGTCLATEMLNKGYKIHTRTTSDKGMAGFLKTAIAYDIYTKADMLLKNWKPIYPDNKTLLENARNILHIPCLPVNDREKDAAQANYELFLELYNSIEGYRPAFEKEEEIRFSLNGQPDSTGCL